MKEISGVVSESKVPVHMGLERMRVIWHGKDGGGNRIPVSKSHRGKRVGKCAYSIDLDFLYSYQEMR